MNRSNFQRIQYGGVTDTEGAKRVARRIMEIYDFDQNGLLDSGEVAPMMVDCYRGFNRTYTPVKAEVQSYSRLLDFNNDGRVTQQDIEELCIRLLVGDMPKKKTETVKRKKFNANIEQRLEVARRLFRQFDKDQSGTLDENEVPMLIEETYRQMGLTYKVTKEEVISWIKMVDKTGDGQVRIEEYEEMVLNSLVKAGIKLD